MKKKQVLKMGVSVLLAAAMMITSVPTAGKASEVKAAGNTPVLDSAIVTYDFNNWNAVAGDASKLTDGSKNIVLESIDGGRRPQLKENTSRGKVLAISEQQYANRGNALLPENPFAGKSVDNGFTLNFWTKTTGKAEGSRCLVDFEVAPATTGRAGTFAVNQQMVYWNTTDQNTYYADYNVGALNLDQTSWKMVTMTITKSEIAFYSDGKKISHTLNGSKTKNGENQEDIEQMINDLAGIGGICDSPADTNVRLGASLATYWNCAGAWLDDVSFFGKALSASEVEALYKETYMEASPMNGVVIQGANKVNEENTIKLKAQIVPEDASDAAGKTITWAAADESILTVNSSGVVTGKKAGKTTVTATVTGTQFQSEPFEIEVLAAQDSLEAGKYYMTVYSTTKNFYASAGNVEQETRSVYVAVSSDGRKFDVLNNGGPIIYAKRGSKRLTAPMIMKENGTFTVVAEDETAANGVHVFTSKDGVHYYDERLDESSDVVARRLKKSSFQLMLKGEDLLKTDSSISLGNAVELTAEEYKHVVDKHGTVVNTGLEEMEELTLIEGSDVMEALKQQRSTANATYSDGSVQKFNVDWSDAAKGQDLTKLGTYTLTGKLQQTKYLNNLKEINKSTLPEDDPENDSATELDNYDETTGTVYYDNTKFVEGMADPCICWDEKTGYYYMTGSYFPEESDKDRLEGDKTEQYDRVVLRRGRTLEELQDRSKQVTIWKVGNQGFEDNTGNQVASGKRYIWAPEIHRVGNYWVVYFTESHGDLFNIFCHALVLDGTKDPYETALKAANGVSEWKDYQMRGGTGSETAAIKNSFCLDMTYFEDASNGTPYVIWAAKPHGNSDLFIAKVNKEQPWALTSDILRLTTPEYGWENVRYMVNEGATVLQKNGKIFMCYSASGTGSEYAIGMMTADQGADLLNINSWTKNPYPLLTSRDVDGEEGPGHNSFTVDKDGNDIFVYHARPTSHNYQHCGWDGNKSLHYNSEPLNDPCRHARLKRVHWAADGTPILKMTYEDELKEENKTVSIKVSVVKPDIKLDKSKLGIKAGDSATLTATVVPAGAAVQWSSSDTDVATVKDGKVTAKKAGTATITATSNGREATCKVTVVSLSKTKLTIVSGKSATLKVNGSKNVTWSTKSKSKATVKNGKVTAKNVGTVTITAKAEGVTLQCKVTVKPGVPKKLILKSKKKVTLKKKKTSQIKVSLPKNTEGKLSYKTSKKKVATVSTKGKITAKGKGTATITVTAKNNKKAKVTIKVIVK